MPHRILDQQHFQQAIAAADNPLPIFRDAIRQCNERLAAFFEQQLPVSELVQLRARFIDLILIEAWKLKLPADAEAALIAVGGYGRGELHPASDIDLMILFGDDEPEELVDPLSDLLTFFWDIGLEVGHSVRTIEESIQKAEQDITVATNLMESRLLIGPKPLHDELREATGPDKLWPSERFFQAKWEEQKQRYEKYDDSVSNLEPNIKESPGGLRDIQMVGWVVKRHYGAETLDELVLHGFLTEQEYQDLRQGEELLWRIRFALHLIAGRREDRILFDYQRTLAEKFGYEDDENGLGVEQFMQRYYRTAIKLNRMNEMLLQLFQEVILLKRHLDAPKPINERFQSRSGFLEVVHENVFKEQPVALLELFLIMEQHPELNGVRASTIRLVRSHRHLVDDSFRADLRARSLFMEILRQPNGITHELRRMNRYGILASYIPVFSNIVGRMQYDLFHVYTVDEHTLFVIRNLRRFALDKHKTEFPLCNDIMAQLPKHELIYLAALFHDIAKGRGGDHSEVGADDAYAFCQHHRLSDHESELVAWLVRNHLLMSITAQRKDISDPEIIAEFAKQVQSLVRLDYLYLLTIADIRATDPKKWNSWKHSLLRELYNSTKQALLRGLQNLQESDEIIQNKQAGARHLLKADGFDPQAANDHWLTLSIDYFQQNSWEEIAWQTKLILASSEEDLPLAVCRKSGTRGGTEIFIYSHDQDDLFALITSLLSQQGLNIVNARLETADTGYTLNSFLVLEENGQPIADTSRIEDIRQQLRKAVS
ncbi:MAG: [protein-PII] uridylyltransferase, partial [Chromatiales bacterium]|nr:[protein-PII] uridylyltransferase [Chromatiales bacterium]